VKNKFWSKKLVTKRPVMDPLWWQDHVLCMLCMESKDQECHENVTVKLGKCKSLTTTVDQMQKYHKEEWVELYKTGQRHQSIKSFIYTAQKRHNLILLRSSVVPLIQY
jgi:hypothetical protein